MFFNTASNKTYDILFYHFKKQLSTWQPIVFNANKDVSDSTITQKKQYLKTAFIRLNSFLHDQMMEKENN